MTDPNPYQSPKAAIINVDVAAQGIEEVYRGQKMVIYAILINLGAIALQVLVHPILGLLVLVGIVVSIIGIFRLATGFGYNIIVRIILVIFMFVPLLSLVVLLVLNSRATKTLRGAGYRVGLLGASK